MPGKRHLYNKDFKACDNCQGKGTVSCSSCHGKGYREVRRSGYDSSNRYYSDTEGENCTLCNGTGDQQCSYCGGTGDQLTYDSTSIVHPDPTDIDDTSDRDETPRSKDDYPTLYEQSLTEGEARRNEIIDWIWNAHVFAAAQQSNLVKWLTDLDLTLANASQSLIDVADPLSQPSSATQARTLAMMLRGLASICSTIDLYKLARR